MINFRDVARNIEARAVAAAVRAVPLEASLNRSLTRAGGPQNLLLPNDDPNTPQFGPDGTPIIRLRANTIPIGEGQLAP